jgi:hypothetical protein
MPPQYVKPFVKSNKNDYRDAEAAGEAVQRPTMRFVPLKSEAQLDLQTIHLAVAGWRRHRTPIMGDSGPSSRPLAPALPGKHRVPSPTSSR